MKLSAALLVTSLFAPALASGQGEKSVNTLSASYSRVKYFDSKSVKYDAVAPSGLIGPRNTDGSAMGIQFSHTRAGGFVISGEILYGVRRYNLSIVQHMDAFDADAVDSLKGVIFNVGSYLARMPYLSPKLMMGYSKRVHPDYTIVGKVGIATKLFHISGYFGDERDFVYRDDAGNRKFIPAATIIETKYGKPPAYANKLFYPGPLSTWELYLGVQRKINFLFLQNLEGGIEVSRGWRNRETVVVKSSPSVNEINASRDVFYDRNISVALRLAVGFWK
ncbi:MAG: hypothetical protein KF744_10305 [Taibaiella sp.]|nr:hypothetical protein [Taibaiella sp.]